MEARIWDKADGGGCEGSGDTLTQVKVSVEGCRALEDVAEVALLAVALFLVVDGAVSPTHICAASEWDTLMDLDSPGNETLGIQGVELTVGLMKWAKDTKMDVRVSVLH